MTKPTPQAASDALELEKEIELGIQEVNAMPVERLQKVLEACNTWDTPGLINEATRDLMAEAYLAHRKALHTAAAQPACNTCVGYGAKEGCTECGKYKSPAQPATDTTVEGDQGAFQPCGKYWGLGHDIECKHGILIDIDEYTEGFQPDVIYPPCPCNPKYCKACKGSGEQDGGDCPDCKSGWIGSVDMLRDLVPDNDDKLLEYLERCFADQDALSPVKFKNAEKYKQAIKSALLSKPAAVPDDVTHLCRFLAELYCEADNLRYSIAKLPAEEISDALIMKWPVLQGTKNQINIKRISEQHYNKDALAKAVSFMLAAAPPPNDERGG